MDGIGTAEVGALFGAAGVLLFLLADRRSLLLGGLAALGTGEALLVAPSVSGTVLAGLGIGGLAVLAAGATVFVRYPAVVTPVVLAAAPFRSPFEFDRDNRFFIAVAEQGELGRLLPLYAVLGAAALALAWRTARGAPVRALPRPLAIPAATFLALACVSLLWTVDPRAGIDVLEFFLLPFAILLGTVARAPFPSWMPRALAAIAIVLASIFAIIGLVEAATQRVLFGATAVDVSNSFRGFFRVTSLFRDPSIYGRHLVLALVVVIAALLLSRVDVRLAAGFAVLFGAALFFTYSQSSMAALFVAALALLIAAAPTRLRVSLAIAAVALVAVTAVAIAADVRDESTRRVTSGRSLRIEDAARAIADRPVAGAGIGGQPAASRRLADRFAGYRAFISHTTPLTVAAELGALGILLYAALLGGAAWTIDQVRRRNRALGLTLAAALLALFVHALTYAGFFEDPLTWFVLAVAASALASATVSERRSVA
jgi:O-antigen ligase